MKRIISVKWGIIFFVVLIAIVFIIAIQFNIFSASQGAVGYIVSPVQSFFSQSSSKISDFFNYFGDTQALKEDNKILKESISELELEVFKLQNDLKNSELIKEEYDYITSFEYETVVAKVVSRGTNDYVHSLIINKGSKDGLEKGLPVITNDGYIIGKLAEVNSLTSIVLLLNDIHSKLSINIDNAERSPGIVEGEFGLSLKLDLVPYDNVINDGDIVYTSGLEQNIPANFVVGKISNINKEEGQLFQHADVEPLVNYDNVTILSIILPTNE